MEVLHFNGRVVDQDADRERHPPKRHQVERLPEPAECDHRDEQRERNRDQDDERAAPATQEKQHHEPGQTGGNHRLAKDAIDCPAHEDRLIKELFYVEAARKCRLHRWHGRANPRNHLQRTRSLRP